MKFIKEKMVPILSLVACALLWHPTASATFYPTTGDLYYNGYYYMNSYFLWGVPTWSISSPGYEHDLWVHNNNYFTSTCTTMTNLPDSYDDCATAGLGDVNGPVFSFGTYDANRITANYYYFGAWSWTSHDTSVSTTGFNLQGQENRNICGVLKSIWCMQATQTRNLISGYSMNWGGFPTTILF